jgi:hypothetical protein
MRHSACTVVLRIMVASILVNTAAIADKSVRPIATTVCSVSSNPKIYAGKIIAVEGRLESDGMHSTDVTDQQCSNVGFAVDALKPFVGESGYAGQDHNW